MTSLPTISSPDAPYPSPASATLTHPAPPFLITTRKLPILKSGPIDALSARLSGLPIPEMIFGDNLVSITHTPTQWSLSFSAEPALARVDATGANMLRVAYASSWSSSREASGTVAEVVKAYDWSYSTDYKGSEALGTGGEGLSPSSDEIPVELLKRRDPILFHDEVVLYESELDDNGISLLSVKVRVMEKRMLLLCRQYMRLDEVLARVRDTRVYVDFGEERVVREYTAREGGWEGLKHALMMTGVPPDGVPVALRDSNQVAALIPVVETYRDSVCFKKAA
ncbi:TIP41-like protein [Podospora conica]|nr:TIP41-like protein [Schizothecium conicum]